MNYTAEYFNKRMTAQEVAAQVVNGDRIFTISDPGILINAVAERGAELTDVGMYVASVQNASDLADPALNGHIDFNSIFMGYVERGAMKKGREVNYCGGHLSDVGRNMKYGIQPTKLYAQASPMDENGYFSFGYCSYGGGEAIECGAQVYLQVNDQIPYVYGECNMIHISDIVGFVECSIPLPEMPEIPATPEDQKIADFVLDRIGNGSTIQIGIGAVANAVTHGLINHKDLGIHTELFVPAMIDLIKAGVVTNRLKTLEPNKTIFGFATGTRSMCDFLDHNSEIEMRPIPWINGTENIAKNNNFVSINGCLAVDLAGQVYSEAIGPYMYSGSGGQYDFVRGAKMAGGQSFLTMHATTKDHKSKITFGQPEGSIVTVLRNDVHMIVTEYGVADLLWKSMPERAKALISVAHPDFRDELTFQAKKVGWLY